MAGRRGLVLPSAKAKRSGPTVTAADAASHAGEATASHQPEATARHRPAPVAIRPDRGAGVRTPVVVVELDLAELLDRVDCAEVSELVQDRGHAAPMKRAAKR
ncbi:MAG TPA: hypothetical protein VGY54_04995 [Polyangiaceae bacterium]|nr:hypothetical protein [Polyangiaceae bacterium]